MFAPALHESPLLQQQQAKVPAGIRAIGCGSDGAPVGNFGLLRTLLCLQQIAEVGAGIGVVRPQCNGSTIGSFGDRRISKPCGKYAMMVQQVSVIGINQQALHDYIQRCLNFPLAI